MSDSFVHLHTHSEYSMLDGLGRIPQLVAEAKRLGQPALALTDHGVMHGAIEFFRECTYNEVKPIIGIEAYQTLWGREMAGRDPQHDRENYHLLLLAKNMTGYRNLLKIASQSQMQGYYYKPRVDHAFLENHTDGVICTTGCLGAEVPNLLMQGKEREAYERLGWYAEVFGKENFFIELQEHTIPELIEVNKVLVPWADKFGLRLLATNDVHYVKESDASPHEMLLCVQTGTSIKSEKRMRLSDESYFLKSRAQMEATFRPLVDLPASAFDNSVLIAEMCEVDLEDKEFHLPDIDIPEGYTYETYLRHCTEEGLEKLYGERSQNLEVQSRKEHELAIINQMGFAVYFLIVADLCNFARSRNIWWNVRGSGAGSLVAYCTGITGIDPLKNQLIFERFLNPARVTMPDFDLDFPDDQREELVRYTIEKYGEDQVAQIVTFGRMKAKAAIRDVGRAQEIPLADVDRIAKMIPGIPGKPVKIKDVLTESHEFYNPELVELYQKQTWVRELVDMSMKLEGVARHSGIHAAAVIVTDRELTHYTPLMRSTKGGITKAITQFEFPVLESIGLLKVDFLGLSTISVMREACRLIYERHGIEYKLDNIPFEGEATVEAFKLLSSGEVSGVFQVESQGMRRVLTEMRPTLFEHIVATISLYRPGPLEYIPNYIRRLHGEEEVEYKHEALKPILEETLGIIIYQEQIIQVLSQLAGYSAGEADLVRRAISKKKEKDIEKHKQIFIDGCAKNNIPKKAAAAIYADIEFFARYGFNKSHAADYAVIVVQTAYLKAHYPVEYMAALLLIERDKTEKVVNFINECRRMGIDVLPPDVNYSGLDFEIQELPSDLQAATHDAHLAFDFPVPAGSAIRFGMAAIKNVGEGPVQVILEAREKGGAFIGLEDFCDRVDLRQVNKRSLECLIKVGAFDRFGLRSQLLTVLDQMVATSSSTHSARASGQLSMFDLMEEAGVAETAPIKLPEIEEAKGKDRLQWEKELLGVYAMSHPMQHLSLDVGKIVTCQCSELDETHDGKNVTMAGMIAGTRTIITKKGDPMAFVTLEDLTGQCDVVVFPRVYAEEKEKLVPDSVVLVKGTAQTREGQTSILADTIQNYVEQAVAVAEPAVQQQTLLDVVPTVNGVPIAKEDELDYTGTSDEADEDLLFATPTADAYLNPFPDDLEDFIPPDEESPFRNEAPSWNTDPRAHNTNGATVKEGGENRSVDQRLGVTVGIKNEREEKSGCKAETQDPLQSVQSHPQDAATGTSAKKDAESVPERNAPKKTLEFAKADAEIASTELTRQQSEIKIQGVSDVSVAESRVSDAADQESADGGVPDPEVSPATGKKNGIVKGSREVNGANGTTSSAPNQTAGKAQRSLHVTFARSGNLDRDKYRLREMRDRLSDPRGRDRFVILIEGNDGGNRLVFPDEYCTINDRLISELIKYFRVHVTVEEN